jgi:outer membrane protein insertion porin family
VLEMGGIVFGGDSDFLKGRFETHGFFEVLRPMVVALSGRLGLAGPLRGTASLPIEERFFAGGATTIRGYKERRVGPLDQAGHPTGGNAQVIVNAELRFPIWRWLTGAVFYDTGAVTPEVTDVRLDRFKSGVGAGVRLSTPVGALRFDVGYPLDAVPNQDRIVRFYLAVGYPF